MYACGHSSGLAMFWNNSVNIKMLSYSYGHVNALCNSKEFCSSYSVIGFYENPNISERNHSWTLLQRLGNNRKNPYIYFGYVNKIPCSWEKEGGRDGNNQQMADFQQVVD
ncbi:hypothetical protein M9H77_30717 [Catharanthus roseus]|uniref:Uncharacterized protein n=1 Tax=Catharanthus roseus TaxID=4058 RepID=A0ACB9ZY06_CATRO|nr:hypothetical protein M9H77_30717 [Catharanthus roseus]